MVNPPSSGYFLNLPSIIQCTSKCCLLQALRLAPLPICQVNYSRPSIPVDVEPGHKEGRLYFTILCKELEYPWIVISKGGPGTNPPKIPRYNCISTPSNFWLPKFTEISHLLCTFLQSSSFCGLYLVNPFVHYHFSATLQRISDFKKLSNRKGPKTEEGEEYNFS